MTHSAITANRIAVSSLAENIAKLKLELDDYPAPKSSLSTETAGTAISLRNIKKFYGARTILNGLHLDILAGEFIVVIGRSGSGKSTLLRLLAGLEKIDSGDIDFGPQDKKPTTRIMFQDSRLLPWKSVLKNVSLGLQKTEASTRQVLHQVGLAERAREWPAVLSGGQRQRVALARALIHEPDLLLLDEPLGALDALTRIEMQALIESVWQQSGFTTVLVTHDVHEAVALADRVILLENGGIVLDKKIDLPRPRNHNDTAFTGIAADILAKILHKPLPRKPHRESDTACRSLFP